jgi:hypothetical protein
MRQHTPGPSLQEPGPRKNASLTTRNLHSYEHTRSAMPGTGTRNREPGRLPIPITAFGIEDPYSIRQVSPEPLPS